MTGITTGTAVKIENPSGGVILDFLMTVEGKPWFAVECKTTDLQASPALRYFGERLDIPYLYQVHLEGQEDILDGKVRVMPAAKFLSGLP